MTRFTSILLNNFEGYFNMEQRYLIPSLLAMSLTLCSCSSLHGNAQSTNTAGTKTKIATTKTYSPTVPESVVLSAKPKLQTPYKVIGEVNVDRYNFVGVKRQQAVMNDLFRKEAAKIGGNAVINMQKNHHFASGEVIRFVS